MQLSTSFEAAGVGARTCMRSASDWKLTATLADQVIEQISAKYAVETIEQRPKGQNRSILHELHFCFSQTTRSMNVPFEFKEYAIFICTSM